jgi:KipI family sensor histidine kinase inhibitor
MKRKSAPGAPSISLLGTRAVLFEAPGALDLSVQKIIWSMAQEAQSWDGVEEAVPGVTNLMLVFSRPAPELPVIEGRLNAAWNAAGVRQPAGRAFDIPIAYGGRNGPDIPVVAAHTGMTFEELVEVHTRPLYTVYALGSHPGYCYLGGMDPRLAVPRKMQPSLSLPAGAVCIGGAQTGISASPGPSGWNMIGLASITFFDPRRSPPAAFSPGDTIRFHAARIEP